VENLIVDAKLLVLLVVANGAPVLAKRFFGGVLDLALDGGRYLGDGRPALGHSKTIRGLVSSLLATAATAPLLGVDWMLGFGIGAAAMAGDLLSSFAKRRMNFPVSSMAIGIDQLPEALLPTLLCWRPLGLSWLDITAIVLCFLAAELLLSQLLFKFHVRDRPY
jgi:hypothetical protein